MLFSMYNQTLSMSSSVRYMPPGALLLIGLPCVSGLHPPRPVCRHRTEPCPSSLCFRAASLQPFLGTYTFDMFSALYTPGALLLIGLPYVRLHPPLPACRHQTEPRPSSLCFREASFQPFLGTHTACVDPQKPGASVRRVPLGAGCAPPSPS
jgi:hypothetical protein